MVNKKQVIEVSGADVDEAIEVGLTQLAVSRDRVEIEIVDEGRKGLLGIGGREAVVRLRVLAAKSTTVNTQKPEPQAEKPSVAVVEEKRTDNKGVADPAPKADNLDGKQPSAEEIETAVTVVSELLEKMSVETRVTSHLSEPDDLTGDRLAIIDVQGDDLSVLIGPRGETLDALQYVSRLMVGHRLQQRARFVIDVEGYRERRQQALTRLAERMAAKAVKRGSPVTLEAMPAHERRIIHMALRDSQAVRTESTGEGKRRRVRIYPEP
jgi:spoIIIJ-associated protein